VSVEIEVTDEFRLWWGELGVDEQDAVARSIRLLEERGIALGHPHTSQVKGSKHGHMRELRVQHRGRPFRVLYAFNPERTALLLIGGEKTGDDRFYELYVPMADAIYDQHLAELEIEKKRT
jgi:hypothetical protein